MGVHALRRSRPSDGAAADYELFSLLGCLWEDHLTRMPLQLEPRTQQLIRCHTLPSIELGHFWRLIQLLLVILRHLKHSVIIHLFPLLLIQYIVLAPENHSSKLSLIRRAKLSSPLHFGSQKTLDLVIELILARSSRRLPRAPRVAHSGSREGCWIVLAALFCILVSNTTEIKFALLVRTAFS